MVCEEEALSFDGPWDADVAVDGDLGIEAETAALARENLGTQEGGNGHGDFLVRQNSRSPVPPSHCRAALGFGPWLIAESRLLPRWDNPEGRTDHS